MRELKRDYWSKEIQATSGKTTLDRREIVAIVKNSPPKGIVIDIHMKSGTIFTTVGLTNDEADKILQDLKILRPPTYEDFGSYIGEKYQYPTL